jgi:hypothetical protein
MAQVHRFVSGFRRSWHRWFGTPRREGPGTLFRNVLRVEELEGLILPNQLFLPGSPLGELALVDSTANRPADLGTVAQPAESADGATASRPAAAVPDQPGQPDASAQTSTPGDQASPVASSSDDAFLQVAIDYSFQDLFTDSGVPAGDHLALANANGASGGNSGATGGLVGGAFAGAGAVGLGTSGQQAPASAHPAPGLSELTAQAQPLPGASPAPAPAPTPSSSPSPAATPTPSAIPQADASAPPTPAATPAVPSPASAAQASLASTAFGQLPLAFEPNQGQFAGGVAFQTQAQGYTVALTATGADFTLSSTGKTTASVQMHVVGGDAAAVGSGADRLPGTVNYLLGQDQSTWVTDVPLYGSVTFHDVYPGIDLVYHAGAGQQLEYDFVVHAGATPSAVHLSFDGGSPRLDQAGNLVVTTGQGDMVEPAPVVYQQGANGSHTTVAGSYTLSDSGQVGFQVGAYDPSRPLVIDPMLCYSTFLGTPLNHQVNHVAVDSLGNAYVVGTRTLPGDPVFTPNTKDAFAAKLDPAGNLVYMTSIGGTQFWPGYFPPEGPGNEEGNGIAVDQFGQAYLTGWTSSTDFPIAGTPYQRYITFNPITNPRGAVVNAFLTKLNAAGDGLLDSTYVGRTHYGDGMGFTYRHQSWPNDPYTYTEWEQYGRAVAVDLWGNAYIVGDTLGVQAIGMSVFDPPAPSDPFHIRDAFLHRINTIDGSASIRWNLWINYNPGGWGNDYAAMGADFATGVALSVDYRHVFVTGYTGSSDILTTPNAFQPTASATIGQYPYTPYDAYVVKIDLTEEPTDPEPNQLWDFDYSTYLQSVGNDQAYDIAVDAGDNAYVTGTTTSDSYPTTAGAYQQLSTSEPFLQGAAFVTKLNPDGTALVYSSLLGGSNTVGYGIALDEQGRAYVTGLTYNLGSYNIGPPPPELDGDVPEVEDGLQVPGTFPLTADATDAYQRGGPQAFLTTFTADGSNLVFSTFHGGENAGHGVAVYLLRDASGNVIDRQPIVGGATEDDLPLVNPTQGTFGDGTVEDGTDGFVAKWTQF